jgi:hypothetical protein
MQSCSRGFLLLSSTLGHLRSSMKRYEKGSTQDLRPPAHRLWHESRVLQTPNVYSPIDRKVTQVDRLEKFSGTILSIGEYKFGVIESLLGFEFVTVDMCFECRFLVFGFVDQIMGERFQVNLRSSQLNSAGLGLTAQVEVAAEFCNFRF